MSDRGVFSFAAPRSLTGAACRRRKSIYDRSDTKVEDTGQGGHRAIPPPAAAPLLSRHSTEGAVRPPSASRPPRSATGPAATATRSPTAAVSLAAPISDLSATRPNNEKRAAAQATPSGPGLHAARCRRTRRRAHDQRHHHPPPRRLHPGPRRRAASGSGQPATAPHPRCQRPDTRCAAQRSRTQLNPKRTLIPYRCSRLPRCSSRALFSAAYIAERDRPLMSISCAALYSPDS